MAAVGELLGRGSNGGREASGEAVSLMQAGGAVLDCGVAGGDRDSGGKATAFGRGGGVKDASQASAWAPVLANGDMRTELEELEV